MFNLVNVKLLSKAGLYHHADPPFCAVCNEPITADSEKFLFVYIGNNVYCVCSDKCFHILRGTYVSG